MLPDLDEYSKWLPVVGTSEIDKANLPAPFVQRLTRIKGLCDYWRQFPNKRSRDVVLYAEDAYHLQKTQAYLDIQLVQRLIGNMEAGTKDFWRTRINAIAEDNIAAARRAGDHRSVAALLKVLVMNNKTDKDDPLELEFDKIIPEQFNTSNDISIVIKGKKTTTRKEMQAILAKYGKKDVKIEDAEYEEVFGKKEDKQ